jgi:hypothetical protein
MISVKIEAKKGVFNGIIKLLVKNSSSLADLTQKISKVGGITKVVKLD